MKTQHASYKRASPEKVRLDYRELQSLDYVKELISALPYVAIILNEERQIVFSNTVLLEKLGLKHEDILGRRPGEALQCINSDKMEAGCGTSGNCQVCGVINTILKCQETGQTATDECRIRLKEDAEEYCLDLEITTTPFTWKTRKFLVFAARDISSEKRREALEKIFFHDVINTAGALQGVVDILKQIDDPEKIGEFIHLLSIVSKDLTEEILNQKSLLAAENGDLAVSKQEFYLRETLEHIIREYQRHELALNKELVLVDQACEYIVNTDPVLLKRIVSNMLKNALEAINPEERVSVECISENSSVVISVQNPGTMPDEVRKQVFQRSYSTKGKGRGLGTYSMKLLGERYLNGKVSFSSDTENGTRFSLHLPA